MTPSSSEQSNDPDQLHGLNSLDELAVAPRHAGEAIPGKCLDFTTGDVRDLLTEIEEAMRQVPVKQHDRSASEQAAVERFTECWVQVRAALYPQERRS